MGDISITLNDLFEKPLHAGNFCLKENQINLHFLEKENYLLWITEIIVEGIYYLNFFFSKQILIA